MTEGSQLFGIEHLKPFVPNQGQKLRKGRLSIPGARYFLTRCTQGRTPGLHENNLGAGIVEALRCLQRDRNIDLRCATIMPDHVHLLFILGDNLNLSRTLAKFKSFTKPLAMHAKLQWQSNFHDHRLRERVPMERFAYYIFMNPYRKGLLGVSESWPWWILNSHYHPEFTQLLTGGKYPQREWLLNAPSASDLVDSDSKRSIKGAGSNSKGGTG